MLCLIDLFILIHDKTGIVGFCTGHMEALQQHCGFISPGIFKNYKILSVKNIWVENTKYKVLINRV